LIPLPLASSGCAAILLPEARQRVHAWYDGTHVPQVRAAIPAITAVRRYRVADVPGVGAPVAHRYVAVYEMDTDDVAGAMAALGAASTGGRIEMTATMDVTANPPVLQ
jgi:hypothetical protein